MYVLFYFIFFKGETTPPQIWRIDVPQNDAKYFETGKKPFAKSHLSCLWVHSPYI